MNIESFVDDLNIKSNLTFIKRNYTIRLRCGRRCFCEATTVLGDSVIEFFKGNHREKLRIRPHVKRNKITVTEKRRQVGNKGRLK